MTTLPALIRWLAAPRMPALRRWAGHVLARAVLALDALPRLASAQTDEPFLAPSIHKTHSY